jgi:hypothetical protein
MTFSTPIDELVELVKERETIRNSTCSFIGRPVSKLESMKILQVTHSDALTVESRFALMMDEPDYIISYMDIPVAWHSTVRGIDSNALPPNPEKWEWVMGVLADTTFASKHVKPLDIAFQIVITLNREADNDVPAKRQ